MDLLMPGGLFSIVLLGGCFLLGLALLAFGLYALIGRGDASLRQAAEPLAQAEGPRPHFQAVCRNPGCRAPLEPETRNCPVCGWDQTRPVSRGEIPARAPVLRQPGDGSAATPEVPLAFLVVRNGPLAGSSFQLYRKTVVGSDPACQVALRDAFVSPEHAAVRRKGKAYVFYDMSVNGSFLMTPDGKKRLDVPHTLRHGDRLELGNTLLTFVLAE